LNRKTLLFVTAVVAVGVLAWDRTTTVPRSVEAQAARAPAAPPARTASGPSGLAPPGSAAPAPAANFLRPAAQVDTASPLAREFAAAGSYQALYERLRDSPEGRTPEGQYYLYQMLRACASITDRRYTYTGAPRPPSPALLKERRERVLAEFPEGSPVREQRLAALEQLGQDKCQGMGGITMTEADLNNLLKSAALGGDPKARLVQAEAEMWAERRSASSGRPGITRPTLNDGQVEAVRAAFVSRDPEAIALAGQMLSYQFRDVSLRLGTDTDPVDAAVLRNAALLLACEYGYPCGANAPMVLSGCALQGRCGVATLADYLFYFSASPYEAQTIDRYRTALRQVADSGDTALLAFNRLPTVINAQTTTTTVVSPGTSTPRK
jgi:hypothetical protein